MLSFPFSSPSLVNVYYEKKTLTNIFKLRVGMKCCIYLQRMHFLLSTCKDHSSSCSHGVELNGDNSELNSYNEFETEFFSTSDRPCFPSYHFSGIVLLLMSLMSLVLLCVTVGGNFTTHVTLAAIFLNIQSLPNKPCEHISETN